MNEPYNVLRRPPAQREAMKTRHDRAEDVAYTLNHAISCGTTDMFIAPTISALFGVQVGCSDPSHDHGAHGHHDHHHDHDHGSHHYGSHDHSTHDHGSHHHAAPAHPPHGHSSAIAPVKTKFNWKNLKSNGKNLTWKMYREEAWHYLRGEIIGDLVAVPLTIAVQRLFPSVMEGIGRLVEPVAAPLFRRGANAAARRWGEREGLPADAPQIVARAESMYHTEIKHLPQVVVWNAFAFTIGTGAQALGQHRRGGTDWQHVQRIMRNKTIGGVISNTLLLGSRALIPNIAEKWDAANSANVIAPTTHFVGKLIGLNDTEITAVTQPSWAGRIERTSELATPPRSV